MRLHLPAPPTPATDVVGGGAFPIHRVYCVGRNYAAHAREMGSDPTREPPFFFMKPADAVVPPRGVVPYPPATRDYQHEVELVVALGDGGNAVPVERALDLVWGYAVGLDMTRRDLQADAKKAGRPWDMAKGFDASAPLGLLHPGKKPPTGAITLHVNGSRKQAARVEDMIWNVAETIAQLSTLVTLAPGDLIFTGTPEGVGPVVAGDTLVGHVDGLTDVEVTITKPAG
jgi:fumarylpyruvate hydrolase